MLVLSSFSSILTQFEIFEHSIYAYISDTTYVVRTRPEGAAPYVFLDARGSVETHYGRWCLSGYVQSVREKHSEARLAKEVHMIGLDTERAYRPGVRFTDMADFLFEKRCQFPNQYLFAVFGTPDEVVG
jgi:hypothetical protein